MRNFFKRITRFIPVFACLMLFALPAFAQSGYFTSATLSFGSIPAGTSKSLTATFNSNGTIPLILLQKNMAGSSAFQRTDSCVSPMPVGQSCTITITFTPATAAFANGSLTIVTNAVPAGIVLSFNGTGVGLSLNQTCVGTATNASIPITCPSVGAGDTMGVAVKETGAGALGEVPNVNSVNDSQNGTYAPVGAKICSTVASPQFCVEQFTRVGTLAAGNLTINIGLNNATGNNEAWAFDVANSSTTGAAIPGPVQGLNGTAVAVNPGDFLIGFNAGSNCDVNSTSAVSPFVIISKPSGSCYLSGETYSVLAAGTQTAGFTGTTDISFTGMFRWAGAVQAYFINVCGANPVTGVAACENFQVGSIQIGGLVNPSTVSVCGTVAAGRRCLNVSLGNLSTN